MLILDNAYLPTGLWICLLMFRSETITNLSNDRSCLRQSYTVLIQRHLERPQAYQQCLVLVDFGDNNLLVADYAEVVTLSVNILLHGFTMLHQH